MQGEAATIGEMGPRGRGTGHGEGREARSSAKSRTQAGRAGHNVGKRTALWWVEEVCLDVDGDAGVIPQHGMVADLLRAELAQSSKQVSPSGCFRCFL